MNVQTALHTLGLGNLDHPDEIHGAYRRRVKQWHPDQFPRNSEMQSMAEERLKQINQAYAVLNEHTKKLHISHGNIIKNSCSESQNQRDDEGGESVYRKGIMDWLRNVITRRGYAPQDSHSADTPRRDSKPASGMGSAGFDRILRQARNGRKRQSDDAPPIARRLMPVSHFRRSSIGTRIEGSRSISPVLPIRRVRRIGAIEGSE